MKLTTDDSSLNTPAVLIDLENLESNIQEMSVLAARAGVKLRPHVKVHENATIAKRQIEAGACGIEVGVVEQAAAMANAGIGDILIAHPNLYRGAKGELLKNLVGQSSLKIAVVVDMYEQAELVSNIAQTLNKKISTLIKIDLGRSSRFGVLPGKAALQIAQKSEKLSGISLDGIYGHEMGAKPTEGDKEATAIEAAEIVTDTAKMLKDRGFRVEHVSLGSSPTFRSTCRLIQAGRFPEITELHPGQFVVGDIMYMMAGGNDMEACSVTVLATVISTSHEDWAMIDAGYKTFGGDSLIQYRESPEFFFHGRPRFGAVQGRPDLWLGRLSAETGSIYYKDPQKGKLKLGERVEIVPNNATLVINIHNCIYGKRNKCIEETLQTTGRGQGN